MDSDNFVACHKKLVWTINDILEEARLNLIRYGIGEFLKSKIGNLFGLSKAYVLCFNSLGIRNRSQLDDLAQSLNREVRETVLELQEIERQWDAFLKDLDTGFAEDSALPTEPITPEHSSARDFEEMDATVVLVSFGGREAGGQWLDELDCPFPMLLDPHRQIYKYFSLTTSVYKVWCVECMTSYAEMMVLGIPLVKPYADDDVHQMGGDVILNKHGAVVWCYKSLTSVDRPSIQQMIQALKGQANDD